MKFKDRLKNAMITLNLSQKQLSEKTGIGPTSISMYLKGQHTPDEQKQKAIAASLGLGEDYFTSDAVEELKRMQKDNDEITSLTVAYVAKKLGMGQATVRIGLQQGVFPWGYAIKTSENRWAYWISAPRFFSIEMVKEGDT